MSEPLIRRWRAGPLVLLFALVSLALWRGEVELIKGWAGLSWLNGYPWAAVPVCVLVAASLLVAVLAAAPPPAQEAIRSRGGGRTCVTFLAIATGVGWLSFEIARRWLETSHAWLMFSPPPLATRIGWLIPPVGAITLCAIEIFFAIDRLLLRLHPWCIALFAAALILVIPASWLSLQLVPAHGYTDEIHAIKAGYPTLWTNLLMGGAAAVATRFGRATGLWAPRSGS
jgi:hypothetical protein